MQGVLDLKCDAEIGEVERALRAAGERWVIGVDEAGRGPLAGPVSVAAVVLDLSELGWTDGLDDSKQLAEAERDRLLPVVRTYAAAHSLVMVEPDEIDTLNILWASMEGMRRAVELVRAEFPAAADAEVLVDGNRPIPQYTGRQRALVRGDSRSWAIAAASIVAKVERDRLMIELDAAFPVYGFARHKGYPTRHHLTALAEHGPCPHHRQSFRPVAEALAARAND